MSEEKQRISPFSIRLATIEDLEACVTLSIEIPKENKWDLFPAPSRPKIEQQFRTLIENKTLLVYENNGVIVGILGLVIDSFWWTDQESIMDVIFYIKEEFRSYKAFNRMLSVAEEFAKINGLPMNLLFFTTKDVHKKFKLLRHRGYESIGFWVSRKRE
jgi:hypothetical protein